MMILPLCIVILLAKTAKPTQDKHRSESGLARQVGICRGVVFKTFFAV